MRCACVNCGGLMPQAEDALSCVCPFCGSRCDACLGGRDTPLSLEKIKELANGMDFMNNEPQEPV